MNEPTRGSGHASDAEFRRRRARWTGLAVVYLVCGWFFPVGVPVFSRREPVVWPAANVQVAEAAAWLRGSIDLGPDPAPEERPWDTAVFRGRVFSHFPPMATLLAAAAMALGAPGLPFGLLFVLVVLPTPWLSYRLFLERSGSVYAAVVMTAAFVLGSSEFFVLSRTMQSGKVWQLNHAVSQVGLLLFLIGYFRKGGFWTAAAGLVICGWSRYTMIAYLLPLAWKACLGRSGLSEGAEGGRGRLGLIAGVAGIVVGFPLLLNALKFGSPFNTGYALIYVGRTSDPHDYPARDADRYGLFSLHFVPRNLYYMNVGPPDSRMIRGQQRLVPNVLGTGIWWMTPLLLLFWVDLRRIWADVSMRPLLVSASVIFAALMTFHTTGAAQRGYNRFSLDFLLVLLVAIAPTAFVGRRRMILSTVLAGLGVAYCRWVGA